MTKFPYHLPLAGLIAVASLTPSRGSAQEAQQRPPNAVQTATSPDSLPFRARQWGAEFAFNDGTLGLGVLRFRSNRQAWLLDAAVSAAWTDAESSFGGDRTATSVFVRLQAGPRRYRPIAAGSAAYVGMGLTGAYGRAASGDELSQVWDAGVFSELGGVYFVTRRLSLGAQVELSVLYSETRQRSSSPAYIARDRRLSVGVPPVRIVGALYF